MKVGYARVSSRDQRLGPQRDAHLADGCEKVFEEKISSREAERNALREAFDYCRPEDMLVVTSLDRLGRSLQELIDLVGELEGRGVGFRSLKENLDTSTAGGRLIFHVFASIAEFERELIRDSTMAGLKAARARGRVGGRPRALDEDRARLARKLKEEGKRPRGRSCKRRKTGCVTISKGRRGGEDVGKHRKRYDGIDPEVEEDGQEHLRQMLETDQEFRREWEANRTKRELGMFILEKRLEQGLSQRELAERVGTSQNRIYVIESGEADVRLATLQRLAEALGFPLVVGDKTFAG